VLLSVAAICWVIATRRMSGMDMGVATRLGLFAFFSAVWVAMMAAMMLPGTVPAVLKRAQAGGMRTLPLFAGSYLGVWALPLALMIVGPGIWIVLAPSPVPGLTPPM
jgi:predicted metal-binding membrane protein